MYAERPYQTAEQRLRADFPDITFDSLQNVPQSELRIQELHDALREIREKAPRALSLLHVITFGSIISQPGSRSGEIILGLNDRNWDYLATYAGQYATSLAKTKMEATLEHELSHLIGYWLEKAHPEIARYYDLIYWGKRDPVTHEVGMNHTGYINQKHLVDMPNIHSEFRDDDIRNYLFNGEPLHYFNFEIGGMDVFDLKDTFEKRKRLLEIVRRRWGGDKPVVVTRHFLVPWEVDDEAVRPISVHLLMSNFKVAPPVDSAWNRELIRKIRLMNGELRPAQRIYKLEVMQDREKYVMGAHRLFIPRRLVDEFVREKSLQDPAGRRILNLIAPATPTPVSPALKKSA